MLCKLGKVSLYCYLGAIFSFTLLLLLENNLNFIIEYNYVYLAPFIYYILVNVFIRFIYSGYDYQVAVRALFLGFMFSLGLYVFKLAPEQVKPFGIYMCVMSFFHYSEFLSIGLIQPKELSTNSFLLYHSPQYVIAAFASWMEFFMESYYFPGLKSVRYLPYIGLTICILGEFLRKLAMLTAKSNFNHLVQCTKADNHELVTHGIYHFFRHPSYVGWFYWSIGTQIILVNPLCVIAYTLASWKFFNERIIIEEINLLNFFGRQYCDYQQKVGTGLPFINGYIIKP